MGNLICIFLRSRVLGNLFSAWIHDYMSYCYKLLFKIIFSILRWYDSSDNHKKLAEMLCNKLKLFIIHDYHRPRSAIVYFCLARKNRHLSKMSIMQQGTKDVYFRMHRPLIRLKKFPMWNWHKPSWNIIASLKFFMPWWSKVLAFMGGHHYPLIRRT